MGYREYREISHKYFVADKAERFEFLYANYYNYAGILTCQRYAFLYMVESYLMNNHWEEYIKRYSGPAYKSTMEHLSECLDRTGTLDFGIVGLDLPEYILIQYKNYCRMKLEFKIFSNALMTFGNKEESIIYRYVTHQISLWDIADEKSISYETAKGRVRDLKKELKARTYLLLAEDLMAS